MRTRRRRLTSRGSSPRPCCRRALRLRPEVLADDFTPAEGWPPRHAGEVDALRLGYLLDPRLVTVAPDAEVIVGARR